MRDTWRQREIVDDRDWNRYKLNSIIQKLKMNKKEEQFHKFFFKKQRRR